MRKLLLLALALLLAACTGEFTPEPTPEPTLPPAQHSPTLYDSLSVRWSLTGILIPPGRSHVPLATADDLVILYSVDGSGENPTLQAIDVLSAEVVWSRPFRSLSALYADPGGVYVGQAGGGATVTKLALRSGAKQWSRNHWTSSGVDYLLVFKDALQVYLVPTKHIIVDVRNGDRLSPFGAESPPRFATAYCGQVWQPPVYLDDLVYLRAGGGVGVGEVCAVDLTTGQLLWRSELSVLSNIITIGGTPVVLLDNGDLVALDPDAGIVQSRLASFDGSPIQTYEPSGATGNFLLAYNIPNETILVYLGDSHQLFAFQESVKAPD